MPHVIAHGPLRARGRAPRGSRSRRRGRTAAAVEQPLVVGIAAEAREAPWRLQARELALPDEGVRRLPARVRPAAPRGKRLPPLERGELPFQGHERPSSAGWKRCTNRRTYAMLLPQRLAGPRPARPSARGGGTARRISPMPLAPRSAREIRRSREGARRRRPSQKAPSSCRASSATAAASARRPGKASDPSTRPTSARPQLRLPGGGDAHVEARGRGRRATRRRARARTRGRPRPPRPAASRARRRP